MYFSQPIRKLLLQFPTYPLSRLSDLGIFKECALIMVRYWLEIKVKSKETMKFEGIVQGRRLTKSRYFNFIVSA